MRAWTWRVKDSPDIDPDASTGGPARWWVPKNHWQAEALAPPSSSPTFQACYKDKGKWGINDLVNPWPAGAPPSSVTDQAAQCAASCAGSPHFSLRRQDTNDPLSVLCYCVDAAAMQKVTNEGGKAIPKNCDCAAGIFGNKNKKFNCIYDQAPSSSQTNTMPALCKTTLPAAGNMMSCQESICPRSVRLSWQLKDGVTHQIPSALQLEALNSGIQVLQIGASFAGAKIMFGEGGNTGSKNAPPSMGTGVMSLLGGESYRFTIMTPDATFTGWKPAQVLVLKMEFFDARVALPTELDRPECKIDVEIGHSTSSPSSLSQISFGSHLFDFP